uniref:RWP-RK domain-containing protein n=1 Tax=Araucaria cunninghamii TaxID=56994 RepID=A0A0D6QR16_ARACU
MPQELVSNRYMTKLGMSAQTISWDESLTFDEVAKFFSVPIAEAANILGVCSSVLKKICRDNGIPRWPYRKFLAGKTVEEIKREAVREKEVTDEVTKVSNENDKSLPSSGTASLGISSAQAAESKPETAGIQTESKSDITATDTGKWQQAVSTAGNILQTSGTKIPQAVRQHPFQMGHRVFMSTYLDEFKQGFPKNGLSSISNRWWGSGGSLSDKNLPEDLQRDETLAVVTASDRSQGGEVGTLAEENSNLNLERDGPLEEKCKSFSNEGMNSHDEGLMHATILSRTRKKNAENGRKALKLAVTHGYGPHKIEEKGKLLLTQIFGFPLPRQWKSSLS